MVPISLALTLSSFSFPHVIKQLKLHGWEWDEGEIANPIPDVEPKLCQQK